MLEKDGYIHSAPEFVVAVGSSERKLPDYESIRVPEVWILSPEGETVEVLQLEGGRLQTAAIVHEGILAPKLFPQAGIDVSAIWE